MTKDQIQRIMFEAAKVTTFLEDDKIFYMASRKPDGSDELIEIEKFYISTEFMNNIIKQVVKECIGVVEETNLIDDDPVANIKERFGVK